MAYMKLGKIKISLGGILVVVISIISLIFPNVVVLIYGAV